MLNSKKTKSKMVSQFRTYALGCGYHSLGSAELEEVKSLRILEIMYDSKVTFETYLSILQCGCRLRSFIWVCWIVLFAVQKSCMRGNFVVLRHRRRVSALCWLHEIYH